MNTSSKSTLSRLLVWSALGVAITAQSAAAQCQGQVFYRLWQPGGQETWYDPGDQIQIQSGQEGHIYIHVAARGENTYTTSARLGYPGEFGYQGDARVVERSVKMEAQNNDDRNNGRIRFRADQPGLVYIGYQINNVTPPGRLNNVPNNCRVGAIGINVTNGGGGGRNVGGDRGGGDRGGDRGGRGSGGDRGGWDRGGGGGDRGGGGGDRGGRGGGGDRGGGRANPGWQAASNLVGLLYEGILRRDDRSDISLDYVRLVQNEGQDGLEKVAMSMLKSQEFQQQALRRIQNEQGRMNDRGEQVNALLWGMYGWLYGDGNDPSERRADEDYDLLSDCLRNNGRACDNLGRSLISNPLFEQNNGDDIDNL